MILSLAHSAINLRQSDL